MIFAEDAKKIVQNSVGWPSNKYVICEQIDALPDVLPIQVVRRTWHEPTHDREVAGIIEKAEKVKATLLNREACPYCHDFNKYQVGAELCKPIQCNEVVGPIQLKECNVFMADGQVPNLVMWNGVGGAAYIDINYCPMCGRDLRNEQNDAQ